jgi:hypothetical protein
METETEDDTRHSGGMFEALVSGVGVIAVFFVGVTALIFGGVWALNRYNPPTSSGSQIQLAATDDSSAIVRPLHQDGREALAEATGLDPASPELRDLVDQACSIGGESINRLEFEEAIAIAWPEIEDATNAATHALEAGCPLRAAHLIP